MNNRIKAFLQCSAVAACMSFASLSHADMNQVMALINDPASAPAIRRCDNNQTVMLCGNQQTMASDS
jgi:hypothetical protein